MKKSPRSISPRKAHLRARIAGTRSNHPEADLTDLRRELKYVTVQEYIQSIVTDPPALTDDQLADLASRLLPVPTTGASAA